MSARPFVHLHCHTHYSLLDGASRVPELVKLVKGHGMNAVAITDHGNLFGAIEFYRECKDAGINPIVGYEAYVAPGKRTEREAKRRGEAGFHLTLLAQNHIGFKNLVKMASLAYLEGYHYIPRIDKDLLEAHHEGIVCLSGCASSEFSEFILKEQMDEATELARWFHKIFGKNFYVEIQNNGLDIQKRCAEGAIDIANKLGLPLVATCDAHYLKQGDAGAHDVLLCINTGRTLKDENRMRYGSDLFYVRAPQEMYELFPGHDEAVKRTQEIADSCDLKLDFKKRHFPVFSPPQGKTAEEHLRELCEAGLEERYGPKAAADARKRYDQAKARMEHELGVICRMGFASYMLIVWDFVRFANSENIMAGARGSACGAIVSYLLKLSHVCPLEYDLLFERFLDPNRSEAPDIDIDFCQDNREKVLEYVRRKYGEASVAQIATFGTMAAKAAIKDVGRVLDVPLEYVNRLTAMVPKVLNISLEDSLAQSPDLRREYDNSAEVKRLIDIALALEGTNRNVGTHAAGVVIANGPIIDYVPVQRINRDKGGKNADYLTTTQWVMGDLEKVGMLKMDFLGLRTLTVVDHALKLIRKSHVGDKPLESIRESDPKTYHLLQNGIDCIPLDDAKTYALLQRGDARGVFQLESDGIRELLKRMKPDNIRDLIATNALYRPGPLGGGMVDAYVNRKHGREKPTYAHPVMEEVLHETYGVLCFHEETLIAMADGSQKPIRELRKGELVHSLNLETQEFEAKECHGCAPTRKGDGLQITLENGACVTVTPDHPLRTWDGFVEAQNLDPSVHLVASAVHTEPVAEEPIDLAPWLGSNEDVAYLLGQLVGDGALSGETIALATGLEKNHEKVLSWMSERLPKLRLNPYFHERCWHIGISCTELLNSPAFGKRKTKFRHWIESLHLDVRAREKHVPSSVLQSPAAVRAAFLAGLLDSDGHWGVNQAGHSICFLTSASERLLDGVARLCQLDGILFTRRPGRIHFWSQQELAERLAPYLLIREPSGKLGVGNRLGRMPRSLLTQKVAAAPSQRSFSASTGIEHATLKRKSAWIRMDVARKAGYEPKDVRFFKIVSIKVVRDIQFFGMSVADHHNLVANGIVAKNCYQEQIMRVLNRLGGIELASAYACIKAISKKKQEIIDQRYAEFVKGAQERGVSAEMADEIFQLIVKFAGYGFNKSHSAAYAKLGYQTAYLKTHYTAEFMAALLSSEIDDSNKRDIMVEHIDDAKRLGAEVLPPNVQEGEPDFTVKDGMIVFGLTAIKGLGRGAAEEILRVRKEGGMFKDFFDFCERIDHKVVPKAGIEKLIKAGAFDKIAAGKRAPLLEALPRAMNAANQAQEDRRHGQRNLFDAFDGGTSAETNGEAPAAAETGLKDVPDWPPSERLKFEKEALDFYITSHPLAQNGDVLRRFASHSVASLKDMQHQQEVFMGGMFSQVRLMNTKKARNGNSQYARCKLEDFSGVVECVMWPDDFVKHKALVANDQICFIAGILEKDREEPIVQITRILTLEQGQRERTAGLVLVFELDAAPEQIDAVASVLKRSPGSCPVFLHVRDGAGKWLKLRTSEGLRVNPQTLVKSDLETILGPGRVEFSRAGAR